MFRIKTMNKIAQVGLNQFPADYQVGDSVEGEEGILVRSAKLHDYPFPDTLWGIARAGAGTNNIPVAECAQKGIVVFNTPGANANGVKELVLAALLMASRDLVGGVEWVKAQAATPDTDVAAAVEKGKSAFVGPELYRKTLGVIGLGAIGALVANAALSLGMEVYGYDPFLSVDTALRLDRHVHVVKDVAELYRVSDYVTIHVPYTPDTRHTINADTIAQMKDGVRMVNLARGELVDDEAMMAALERGKVARYVTDFPNNTITLAPNVVPIPHLGASTPESEDNCAIMAAQQLRDFLENGNIKNSVNFPNVEMERSGVQRLCIIHRNIPAMLANITAQLSGDGVNVENMTNKSRGDFAYTLVDVGSAVEESVIDDIRAIDGIIRVRVIS
ncbi:phosphoglycerate dehydrogenase [Pseudoflavonifractor capillosus]|uniref:phosphoglycerate dehydrogenase n=1 Tax=Pseudoflavonifractor TaxID=1017280 RepID=UPI000B3A015D|nr:MULTISPECIES: phosphoglycerate dehydrogenase [Pseudoflavonifractor]MBM6693674.1 phosphoglycerate dehydrogenase [Pseudoflavonifractor capillosus]OUN99243.1 3-phosphoglycerate dehydrogenase [Pseudoflavonifractor sp. An44]OUP62980.1 3-phosphoglycerate dehydrogenase [Pseudoflavonifractor sp. An176]